MVLNDHFKIMTTVQKNGMNCICYIAELSCGAECLYFFLTIIFF